MRRHEPQDAAQELFDVWVAVLNQNLKPEQALLIAASPRLANVATLESSKRLAFMLEQMANLRNAKTLIIADSGVGKTNRPADNRILADIIIQHANALANLARSQEASLLYDAAEKFYGVSR
jgi:hypothetical protein